MASSILQLATEAFALYAPDGSNVDRYVIWIKQGWQRFVHRTGLVFTVTSELPFTPGAWLYSLPDDYRVLKKNGVYRYYAPRAITSAVHSNVTRTITTSTPHNLTVGVTVVVLVTDAPLGAGDINDFDGTWIVETVPDAFSFTYTDATRPGACSGTHGTIAGSTATKIFLTFTEEGEIVVSEGWDTTQGQPTQYFFPDSLHIGFNLVPDGTDPMAVLRYDAEAGTVDVSADLPVPSYLEQGLIGFGHERQALALDPPNAAKAQLGAGDFEEAVSIWLADEVTRTQFRARDVEDL